MPTIYETKFDGSNGVRYFHISLVRLYLDQAHKHAMDANFAENENPLTSSITAIVFSAMAIEAFINQVSEDVLDKEELNKFFHLRKPYNIKTKKDRSAPSIEFYLRSVSIMNLRKK